MLTGRYESLDEVFAHCAEILKAHEEKIAALEARLAVLEEAGKSSPEAEDQPKEKKRRGSSE